MPETLDSIRRAQQGIPNPFRREIPGQSLTREPGEYPFEQPARIDNPVEAVDTLLQKLNEPSNLNSLLNLVDAGISIESIVRAITFSAFTDGMITVDTAELSNPILILEVLAIAKKAGISDSRILNSYPEDAVSMEDSLALMKQFKPKKYKTLLMRAQSLNEEKNIEQKDDFDAAEGSFMSPSSGPVLAAMPIREAEPGFVSEQPLELNIEDDIPEEFQEEEEEEELI